MIKLLLFMLNVYFFHSRNYLPEDIRKNADKRMQNIARDDLEAAEAIERVVTGVERGKPVNDWSRQYLFDQPQTVILGLSGEPLSTRDSELPL